MLFDNLAAERVLGHLRETNALLENGHFSLKGQECSDTFVDKDRLLLSDAAAGDIGFLMHRAFTDVPLDLVVAANGGSIVKVTTAMAAGHHNPKDKRPKDRLSFHLESGKMRSSFANFLAERTKPLHTVLIDDIFTTGFSLHEAAASLLKFPCINLVGAAVICSRKPLTDELGTLVIEEIPQAPILPVQALLELDLKHWVQGGKCPLCRKKVPHTAGYGGLKRAS